MGAVKPGQKEFIVPVQGNAVSVFVDTEDGLLKCNVSKRIINSLKDFS